MSNIPVVTLNALSSAAAMGFLAVVRLHESGLRGEQVPRALEILKRGDCLVTWKCPHHPREVHFMGVPQKGAKG